MSRAALAVLRLLFAVGVASLVILVAVVWTCTRLPLLLVRLGRPRRARAMMRLVARRGWPLPATAWLRAGSLALLWDGRFEAARAQARVMRRSAATSDATAAIEIELLAGLLLDRADESRALFDEHRDELRRRGARRHELTFGEPGLAALFHLHDGEIAECRQALGAVLARTRRSPAAELARFLLATAAHREGRDDEARARLDACLSRPSGLFVARWAVQARAELADGAKTAGAKTDGAGATRAHPSRRRGLFADLRAGLGAMFFLRPVPIRGATFERVAALAAASVLAAAIAMGAGYSPGAFFWWTAGLTLFSPIALLLAAAWVAASILGIRGRAAELAVALFRSLPFFLVAEAFARLHWHPSESAYSAMEWVLGLWWIVFALSQMRRAVRGRAVRRWMAAAIVAASWLVPLGLTAHATLWAVPSSADDYLRQRATRERRIHNQGAAVAIAESSLLAGRPGVTDLYFVGVAGSDVQDVFGKEIHSARTLFDDGFHTRGRSIVLSNAADRGEAPLATALNLEHALAAIGKKMNREEDILVLYVTSHGSKSGIALQWHEANAFEGSESLDPAMLRRELDEAGIAWRILVLSACHSGVFVDALRGAKTVVFTAAAADRQSFGCKNGGEFTDFGRALLAERLPEGRPFVDAFEQVRADIHAREVAEKLEPSLPQLDVGDAIGMKLRALDEGRAR